MQLSILELLFRSYVFHLFNSPPVLGKAMANLGVSVALVLGIVFWKWGDVDIHCVEAAILIKH